MSDQEYLDACIYKVHKNQEYANAYSMLKSKVLSMTPQKFISILDFEDTLVDIENGMFSDAIVKYVENTKNIDENATLFMASDKYFTVDDIDSFAIGCRMDSDRVDDMIILTELINIDSSQKLWLTTLADTTNIPAIIDSIFDEANYIIENGPISNIIIDMVTRTRNDRAKYISMISTIAANKYGIVLMEPSSKTYFGQQFYEHTIHLSKINVDPLKKRVNHKESKKYKDEFKNMLIAKEYIDLGNCNIQLMPFDKALEAMPPVFHYQTFKKELIIAGFDSNSDKLISGKLQLLGYHKNNKKMWTKE